MRVLLLILALGSVSAFRRSKEDPPKALSPERKTCNHHGIKVDGECACVPVCFLVFSFFLLSS